MRAKNNTPPQVVGQIMTFPIKSSGTHGSLINNVGNNLQPTSRTRQGITLFCPLFKEHFNQAPFTTIIKHFLSQNRKYICNYSGTTEENQPQTCPQCCPPAYIAGRSPAGRQYYPSDNGLQASRWITEPWTLNYAHKIKALHFSCVSIWHLTFSHR